MSTNVRIGLLGSFRLSRADGAAAGVLSRRGQGLLAYLALARDGKVTREAAAALLWADRGEEQARHSLRQCLLTLRKAIGDTESTLIHSNGSELSIALERADIDAVQFIALAVRPEEAAMAEALSLYRGPLLAGVSLASPPFRDWLDSERAHLQRVWRHALGRMTQLRLERGDAAGAAELARELISSDDLDEEAHRLLMQALAAQGRRAEALRHYASLQETLRREVKSEPAFESKALAESLRQASADPSVPAVSSRPAEPTAAVSSSHQAEPIVPAATSPAVEPPAIDAKSLQLGLVPEAVVATAPVRLRQPRRPRRPRPRRAMKALSSLAHHAVDAPGRILGRLKVRKLIELPNETESGQPRLAILPFGTTSDDPHEESLARALADEIGAALAAISTIRLVGYPAFVPNDPLHRAEVARTHKVRYVLEGRVQRSGDTLRIWVKLYDDEAKEQIWGQRFVGDFKQLLSLQDEITLEVITALQVTLTEGEQERLLLMHGTRNLDAWLLSSQANQLTRRAVKADIERARELYERALAVDPRHPGAWEGLAWTYLLPVWFGWTQDTAAALGEAKENARRALELDPSRGRTYSLLGAIAMVSGKPGEAVASGQRAIEMSPQDAEAYAILAYIFSYCGDIELAIKLMERAMALSPFPPRWYRWCLGRAYRLTGRLAEAVELLRVGAEEKLPTIEPRVELLLCLAALGNAAEARAVAQDVLRDEPTFSVSRWMARLTGPSGSRWPREAELLRAAGVPLG